jgi:hypothetical protein
MEDFMMEEFSSGGGLASMGGLANIRDLKSQLKGSGAEEDSG